MHTELSSQIEEIGKHLDKIEPDERHYFLEAGANDGLKQSNSISLEMMNWDGILVEPSPLAFVKLEKNRGCTYKFQCALGDGKQDKLTGSFTNGSLTGSCDTELIKKDLRASPTKKFVEKFSSKIGSYLRFLEKPRLIEVNTKTISEIIEATNISNIDIMTLDIEGYESTALRGISQSHDPRIGAIETRTKNSLEISDFFLSRNYILIRNLTSFTVENNPEWSRDHQDYLWVKIDDENALRACNTLIGASSTDSNP
mgnify:CR=1 FL=1